MQLTELLALLSRCEADRQFMFRLEEEVALYVRRSVDSQVLVFPLLNSYLRLMVHATAQRFSMSSTSEPAFDHNGLKSVLCRKKPGTRCPALLYADLIPNTTLNTLYDNTIATSSPVQAHCEYLSAHETAWPLRYSYCGDERDSSQLRARPCEYNATCEHIREICVMRSGGDDDDVDKKDACEWLAACLPGAPSVRQVNANIYMAVFPSITLASAADGVQAVEGPHGASFACSMRRMQDASSDTLEACGLPPPRRRRHMDTAAMGRMLRHALPKSTTT
eukprot:jgi/Chlat1/3653/Chrsp238S03634